MRWIIAFLLLSVACALAQPQLGPYTLYNVTDSHAIRSPKIASYQDTLTTIYWVDEGPVSSTAYYAIVNRNGTLSDIIEIAHCLAPNRLFVEAAHPSMALLSLRHDDSFDLFAVEVDPFQPLDSVLIVSETAGFEEGFGVLPNYPDEASLSVETGFPVWIATWTTARLSAISHEWYSTAHFAFSSMYDGFVVRQFGDTIPTVAHSVPHAFWGGGDTVSVSAASLSGNTIGYSLYDFIEGTHHEPVVIVVCNHDIVSLLETGHGLYYIDVEPNQPGLYRILGYTENGPCSVVAESAFLRNFDILAPRRGWGYAGLSISPSELWIESADITGGFTPRANPLHRTAAGASHRESDMTLTLFGYIETLWTESVNNQDDAT